MAVFPIWSAPGWSVNMGRVFQQLPRCTWTPVLLRFRLVPCSPEKTTDPFFRAQVRLKADLYWLCINCASHVCSHNTSTVTVFFIYKMLSFITTNVISPFIYQSPAIGHLAVLFVLWHWCHLECLTHAALFTCLCFSRSSDCFFGDKSEWHICGIWELHHLWLREDWSNTPQDVVSHTSIVTAVYLKFLIYSEVVRLGKHIASWRSVASKYSHLQGEKLVKVDKNLVPVKQW